MGLREHRERISRASLQGQIFTCLLVFSGLMLLLLWLLQVVYLDEFYERIKNQQIESAAASVIQSLDTEDMEQAAADAEEQDDRQSDEEELFEAAELYAAVLEIQDGYLMLESAEYGKVQAAITDDTIVEGADGFEIGQVVKVIYDGKMTRSIPAQVNGKLIGVYAVTGEVTEVREGSVTLMQADTHNEVILTLPQDAPALAEGDVITAYTTGISTMSLPPQMNAVAVVR